MLTLWTEKVILYWDLPDRQIANNHKVGSQSVFDALCRKFGETMKDAGRTRASKDVFLLVRDPVKRFISAAATLARNKGSFVDVDELLMVQPDDPHLWPQTKFAPNTQRVFLYRFPDHLDQFAEDCGLDKIKHLHESSWIPVLSDRQIDWVKKVYRRDQTMFDSIRAPGQLKCESLSYCCA